MADDIDDIPRDRWGRPMLLVGGKLVAFTRASTLSNAIESTYNLELWKQRQTAVGLVSRPDLVAKVQAKGDDKSVMNEVVASAMEAAESKRGANIGTAVHGFCEMVDQGVQLPRGVDPEIRGSVKAWLLGLREEKIEIAGIETFVGCREILSAGTFDRLVRWQGGLYVLDIKTGADAPRYAHTASVQMAVYAHGTRYSPKSGWADLSLLDEGVSQTRAIMAHLPQNGSMSCTFHWVDIETGWAFARVAAGVREWWKEKPAWPMESS
jgi:hypothetical protein